MYDILIVSRLLLQQCHNVFRYPYLPISAVCLCRFHDQTAAWFLWYGMAIGMSREEALDIPYGELLDMIAIQQIKLEGAKLCRVMSDEDVIPDVR